MEKRELINLLENTNLSDDAEVTVCFCFNTSGDTENGEINEILVENGEIILDCCTTAENCDY